MADDDGTKGKCGCCGGGGRKKKSPPVEEKPQEHKDRLSERSQRDRAPPPPDPAMQAAAAKLELSAGEQERVTKALEAEMERRRRWKLLLRVKGLRRGAGKIPADGKGRSIEDVLSGDIFGAAPKPPPSSEGVAAETPDPEVAAAPPDMLAELERSNSLEEKRKDWIKKMQHGGQMSPKKAEKKRKPPREPVGQPDSLTIDAETAKEVGSHNSFMKMLQKILKESKVEDNLDNKKPTDMTPEELVAFRRENPKGWDAIANANSIASFGLAKPTAAADEERARKTVQKKGSKKRQVLQVDKKIEVASIPAGEDFEPGEQVQRSSGRVSFKPDVLKKQ